MQTNIFCWYAQNGALFTQIPLVSIAFSCVKDPVSEAVMLPAATPKQSRV